MLLIAKFEKKVTISGDIGVHQICVPQNNIVFLHVLVCWICIVVGSNPIHIFIWFYGVEWVIFCSVGAEPRLSANFGQFGGDIMLNFFDSRLQIIVF